MPEDRDDKELEIVRRLAGYVDANPFACDSSAGIARWWLHLDIEDTGPLQQALAWMLAQQLMEEIVAADGRLRYRRIGTKEQFDRALAGIDPAKGGL